MNLFALPTTIPWLSLIWLSLLVPAVVLMFVPPEQRQTIRIIGTAGALVSLILTVLVYGAYDSSSAVKLQFIEELPWVPQIGINYTLGVDGISLPLLLLNGIVIVASALVSWNIEERAREYWALLLLAAAGAYGVFMSVDLFLLFIFYELTLIPKFLLIGGWGKTRREYGATKLALYMMGGSALITAGIVAIYFGSGLRTFDMRMLQQAALFPRAFQIIWFAPLFAGFAVLAGMVPFHTWAPTGHTAAPTAISMLLAGVMMKLGSYGCLRVGMTLLPEGALTWLLPIALLTLVGAVYGSLIAAAQRDFKFMIAYSSISHMALVLMGLAAGNAIGIQGAVLQMFAHGVMTALLFAVVGRMVYDRTHTRDLRELGGLFGVMPFVAVMFIIGGLSSMGMPGFAGFFAEFNVFIGMWQRFPLVAIIGALAIPITAAYTLRAMLSAFFGALKNQSFHHLPKLTVQEYIVGAFLAAILIISGIYPAYLTAPIQSGVQPVAEALGRAMIVAVTR
jgi:NADH-quinone oxidoreductase subunit M